MSIPSGQTRELATRLDNWWQTSTLNTSRQPPVVPFPPSTPPDFDASNSYRVAAAAIEMVRGIVLHALEETPQQYSVSKELGIDTHALYSSRQRMSAPTPPGGVPWTLKPSQFPWNAIQVCFLPEQIRQLQAGRVLFTEYHGIYFEKKGAVTEVWPLLTLTVAGQRFIRNNHQLLRG